MTRIQYSINSELKNSAEAIFQSLGIPPKVAISMFFREVVTRRELPFKQTKVPNNETIQTIHEAEKGDGHKFNSPEEGLKFLGF